jgi:hypothetical protein
VSMADRERMSKRCAEEGCTWVYYYVPGSQDWERCKWCDSVRQKRSGQGKVYEGGPGPEPQWTKAVKP